jgi:hypothetical protein
MVLRHAACERCASKLEQIVQHWLWRVAMGPTFMEIAQLPEVPEVGP